MERVAETIGTRLGQFLTSQGISFYEFEKRTGFSHGLVGKIVKKGNDFGVKKLGIIFSSFPRLNPIWLISGQESMLLPVGPANASFTDASQNKDHGFSSAEAVKTATYDLENGREFSPSRPEEDFMKEYGFNEDEAKVFLSNISIKLTSGQFSASLERLIIFIENNPSLSDTDKRKIIRPIFELRSYLLHSVKHAITSEAKYSGALDAFKLLASQLQPLNAQPAPSNARRE